MSDDKLTHSYRETRRAADSPPRASRLATAAVRAAIASDTAHGAVIPPIYLSSNYTFEGFGQPRRYDYSRTANPTRDALAGAIAELEGGAGCVITSSGMSAVLLVTQLLGPDGLLIAPHDCYGGTYRLLEALDRKGQLRVRFVDQTNPTALAHAFEARPKLIWIETPSNPLLRIVDIADLAARAHAHGALVVVDNTFLSPAAQRPLAFGADLVVHSTTKYLNGHSDVVGGAVVAADGAVAAELAAWANCLGLTSSPFDGYLTLRGLRTLFARFRVHEENARAIVDLLTDHEGVANVFYPGLASHPGHTIARKQQTGFGAMVSFRVRGGADAVRALLDGLRYFTLAESLGGTESLIAHPTTMTHAAMSAEARERAGIDDALLRLSVGIEDAFDLVADLREGLDRAAAVSADLGEARDGLRATC
jgi:cystathionine gamma-synthase